MRRRTDVVVIGSGFGGSIVGCRLAQAGKEVCVLERGRRWSATDFPRSPSQVARDGFWDVAEGRFGLVEYRAFPRITCFRAAAWVEGRCTTSTCTSGRRRASSRIRAGPVK